MKRVLEREKAFRNPPRMLDACAYEASGHAAKTLALEVLIEA